MNLRVSWRKYGHPVESKSQPPCTLTHTHESLRKALYQIFSNVKQNSHISCLSYGLFVFISLSFRTKLGLYTCSRFYSRVAYTTVARVAGSWNGAPRCTAIPTTVVPNGQKSNHIRQRHETLGLTHLTAHSATIYTVYSFSMYEKLITNFSVSTVLSSG